MYHQVLINTVMNQTILPEISHFNNEASWNLVAFRLPDLYRRGLIVIKKKIKWILYFISSIHSIKFLYHLFVKNNNPQSSYKRSQLSANIHLAFMHSHKFAQALFAVPIHM